eukprot:Em0011g403a
MSLTLRQRKKLTEQQRTYALVLWPEEDSVSIVPLDTVVSSNGHECIVQNGRRMHTGLLAAKGTVLYVGALETTAQVSPNTQVLPQQHTILPAAAIEGTVSELPTHSQVLPQQHTILPAAAKEGTVSELPTHSQPSLLAHSVAHQSSVLPLPSQHTILPAAAIEGTASGLPTHSQPSLLVPSVAHQSSVLPLPSQVLPQQHTFLPAAAIEGTASGLLYHSQPSYTDVDFLTDLDTNMAYIPRAPASSRPTAPVRLTILDDNVIKTLPSSEIDKAHLKSAMEVIKCNNKLCVPAKERESALPVEELKELKTLVFQQCMGLTSTEFEAVWKDYVQAIGQACKRARERKRKNTSEGHV